MDSCRKGQGTEQRLLPQQYSKSKFRATLLFIISHQKGQMDDATTDFQKYTWGEIYTAQQTCGHTRNNVQEAHTKHGKVRNNQ